MYVCLQNQEYHNVVGYGKNYETLIDRRSGRTGSVSRFPNTHADRPASRGCDYEVCSYRTNVHDIRFVSKLRTLYADEPTDVPVPELDSSAHRRRLSWRRAEHERRELISIHAA